MRPALLYRLERALAASAAAAAGLGAAECCSASMVYSGVVNIPLPSTVDGLYINLITLQTATSGLALSSWDINPYYSQGAQFFGSSTNGTLAQAANGPALNVPSGTFVGPGSVFNMGISSGANFSPLSFGKLAFRFLNEQTGQINYGWAHIRVPGQGQPGVLFDYYYENVGGSIIVDFPAAGTTWPLALMAVGLCRRRRA